MAKSKKFDFPPLREVAFEINFSPRMKLFDKISDFQESIANEYPNISREQFVPVVLPSQSPDITDFPHQRFVFENIGNTKLVRISIRSFNVVEKSYKSFNSFSKELRTLWMKFKKHCGKFATNRIGLRYINHLLLPISDQHENISEYIRPHYDMNIFKHRNILNMKIEARIKINDHKLTVRSGIIERIKKPDLEQLMYLLDYDCFEDGSKLSGDPMTRISRFHRVIEKQFLSDINNSYVKFMETGKWQ